MIQSLEQAGHNQAMLDRYALFFLGFDSCDSQDSNSMDQWPTFYNGDSSSSIKEWYIVSIILKFPVKLDN